MSGPYWRLKPGLMGLKRFMPNSAVQWAITNGYGWPTHYEPVCRDCPRLPNPSNEGGARG